MSGHQQGHESVRHGRWFGDGSAQVEECPDYPSTPNRDSCGRFLERGGAVLIHSNSADRMHRQLTEGEAPGWRSPHKAIPIIALSAHQEFSPHLLAEVDPDERAAYFGNIDPEVAEIMDVYDLGDSGTFRCAPRHNEADWSPKGEDKD
jgi:hypothetical protein